MVPKRPGLGGPASFNNGLNLGSITTLYTTHVSTVLAAASPDSRIGFMVVVAEDEDEADRFKWGNTCLLFAKEN